MNLAILVVILLIGTSVAYAEISSPKKQLDLGVMAEEIQCRDDKILLIRDNGRPACLTPDTAQIFSERGWMIIEMVKPVGLAGEITVGAILPLTGDLATHGNINLAGMQLGVTHFNEHLASLDADWSLALLTEDSSTDPAVALEKLASFDDKDISLIIGPEASSNIQNIKEYADTRDMLLLSCCSTAPALAIADDSVYRLVPDDSNQGVALAKLLQDQGIEVMIPVWRADTWGNGIQAATVDSFTLRGGVAADGISYDPISHEFSNSTQMLAQSVEGHIADVGADKVAVVFLGFAEVLDFMQSSAQHEILDDVRWFGPADITNEYSLTSDPMASAFTEATKFTTVQVGLPDNTTHQMIKDHINQTMSVIPNFFTYSSYDASWVMGLSILEAQSTDASKVKDVLASVVEKYDGALGDISLNDAGDLAQTDYEVWGIRDGAWVQLGDYRYADDSVSLN